MIIIIMSITQFLLCIHSIDLFLLPHPRPLWFSTEGSPQTNFTANPCFPLSQEVIRLSLNFSGGLLLIGHLIYLHPISQKDHNFRQTDGFPRHVFIMAAYISSVIRPSTFPIIESSQKVYVFREVDGLVFCPVGK